MRESRNSKKILFFRVSKTEGKRKNKGIRGLIIKGGTDYLTLISLFVSCSYHYTTTYHWEGRIWGGSNIALTKRRSDKK